MNETITRSSSSVRPSATHEEISRYAQELWEKYGRPSGRDEEIWLEAEQHLQSRSEAATKTPDTLATPPASAPTRATRPSGAIATPRMPSGRSSRKQS